MVMEETPLPERDFMDWYCSVAVVWEVESVVEMNTVRGVSFLMFSLRVIGGRSRRTLALVLEGVFCHQRADALGDAEDELVGCL